MDEPTVGLDPLARRAVHDRIRTLRDKLGVTILLTTHDMDEADGLCDRIALMHQAKIAIVGSPEQLKAQIGAEATLEDVFASFIGGAIGPEGGYNEARVARNSARQRG